MSDIVADATQDHAEQKLHTQRWSLAWHHLALAAITFISIFMNFFQLGIGGFDSYYPPAIRSMMDSWHNFFFASYDPGGFVTVDKPPLGLWLEVLSARIFGFNSFSVLLPQALAGVLAVILLYYLVRRHFGIIAGLLAALALALSPISIITNRNITVDSTLALTLLIGAWAILRATETGRLRWLLLSAAIIGIGFNIKMMEAYLIIPAFGLLYLLAAPHKIWKRVGYLSLATLLLLIISFSWITIVDMTPAPQRPYVDSTQDNSELSLALGYNGIQRIFGGLGGGKGAFPISGSFPKNMDSIPSTNGAPPSGITGPSASNANSAMQSLFAGGGGAGGLFDIGNPGPLRLFTQPLASQIVWLLPLALFGLLALLWQRRLRFQEDKQQQSMVLWGTWLLTMGIFFSVGSFFHQYYMTEMAPAIAALVGIGIVMMWRDYRRNGWKGWVLPLALAVTLAEQIYTLTAYPTWGRWMIPLIAIFGLLAIGILVGIRLFPQLKMGIPKERLLVASIGIGMLALLIAPTVWAAIPVLGNAQGDVLEAGPQSGNSSIAKVMSTTAGNKLIQYLEANQGHAKFLVATPSSMGMTDSLILATNKPVMSLGGFSGGDSILTTSQLAQMVSQGTVRFFLLNGTGSGQARLPQMPQQAGGSSPSQGIPGGIGGPGSQQSTLTSWVTKHCKTVPPDLWQSSSTNTSTSGIPGGASQLYDCASAH